MTPEQIAQAQVASGQQAVVPTGSQQQSPDINTASAILPTAIAGMTAPLLNASESNANNGLNKDQMADFAQKATQASRENSPQANNQTQSNSGELNSIAESINSQNNNNSDYVDSNGFNTMSELQQDNAAQSTMRMSSNMETMAGLAQARSGGFEMTNLEGENIAFSTDKGAGHNLMMNGNDTGMPFEKFSGMMQNPELAAQFSNAIDSSELSNKDVYNTTNNLLQELQMQGEQADKRQRVHNNASDTLSNMQHREMVEATIGETELLPDYVG